MRLPLALSLIASTALPLSALAGPDQSPPVPDAAVDLRTREGTTLVSAHWRFADAAIVDAVNRAPTLDLSPTGATVKTHDIAPRIGTPEFDNAQWTELDAATLEQRRTNGKLAFGWYRLDVTIPERVNQLGVAGMTAILEIAVDDYAEVWVDGSLPQVLGTSGGPLIKGWNSPNRVTLTTNARPGQKIQIAVFASNGPLSAPPSNYVWIRSATLDFYAPGRAMTNPPKPVEATVQRMDPAIDGIVPKAARFEKLADAFAFTEGPIWVPALPAGASYGGGGTGGYLLFSDPNKNVIHRYDPGTGEVSIYRTKSGYTDGGPGAGPNIGEYHQPGSNGLTLDFKGRLTICEHGNRRVTRLEPNGTITVLADRSGGKRLNSPNDLVYRSDGVLYFTDPPFGLPKVFDDPHKELATSGVFCLRDGTLSVVSTDLKGPNGLAFSPDEKYLYVDNWDEKKKVIVRYDVAKDGSLSNGRDFVDLTSSLQGELCFDGLKVDTHGNVYVASPDGLRIYDETGKHLGTIVLPEIPANFTFGDADGQSLYICARTGLYRVHLEVPGIHPAVNPTALIAATPDLARERSARSR
ncbi:MAG: SMP-30/gluconolactonase/LRE family protein [Planctomycetota bacterium]